MGHHGQTKWPPSEGPFGTGTPEGEGDPGDVVPAGNGSRPLIVLPTFLDGRGERVSPDTPSPSLLISVINIPSYVYEAPEIA